MRERGDLTVLHEPLMYYYYLHRSERLFTGFEPEPDHPTEFADIRDQMLSAARDRPVFVKDMAYYAAQEVLADAELLGHMTHAFLVRDPAEAIVSYARLDPNFTREEMGYIAQNALAQDLVSRGVPVHVVLSSDLRSEPDKTMRAYWRFAGLAAVGDALSWEAHTPKDWEAVKDWHGAVRNSTGIRPPETSDAQAALRALPARFQDIYEAHLPAYRALCALAQHA